ncbi:hypothetical protein SARC_10413 [Sphaeroforma arctica JP610]|uniref:Uncharacterized protein n=1 Tax=Sphaeroforma arctica JP610 TaxID=667725 RepID=A0A0L0FKY4_9EUKA|nr:hypothetical protein SARC_10413 [Sphaeroforma arctica JP610]KNC77116.1 hypothetical protein SARC_10413 [Sphaeroforma arctica JP610]|eukprot:XP_014151018.1 hypothetical protein SARC_10413 [Sphaeroforma arctica JP610]
MHTYIRIQFYLLMDICALSRLTKDFFTYTSGESLSIAQHGTLADALGRALQQQHSQKRLSGHSAISSPVATHKPTDNASLSDAPLHSHSDDFLHAHISREGSVYASRSQSPLSALTSAADHASSAGVGDSRVATESSAANKALDAIRIDGMKSNDEPSMFGSLIALSGRIEMVAAAVVVLAVIQLVYGWEVLFIAIVSTTIELAVKSVFALGCLAVPLIVTSAVSGSLETDLTSSPLLQICWIVDAVMLCSSVYVMPERLGLAGFLLVYMCGLASLEGIRAAHTTDGPLAPGPGMITWALLSSGVTTSLIQVLIYSGILIARICGPTVSSKAWHRPNSPYSPSYIEQLAKSNSRASTRTSSPIPTLRDRSVPPSPRTHISTVPVSGRRPWSNPATPTPSAVQQVSTRPVKRQISPSKQRWPAEKGCGEGDGATDDVPHKVQTRGSEICKVKHSPGTAVPVSIIDSVARGVLSVGGSEARAIGSAVLGKKGSVGAKVDTPKTTDAIKRVSLGGESLDNHVQVDAQKQAPEDMQGSNRKNISNEVDSKAPGKSRSPDAAQMKGESSARQENVTPSRATAENPGKASPQLQTQAPPMKTHLPREIKNWSAYRGYLRDVERDFKTRKMTKFKCDADTLFAQPVFLAITAEFLCQTDINRRIHNQYERSRISEVQFVQESNFFTGDKKYVMFLYSGERPDYVVFQSDFAQVIVRYLQTETETPPRLKISNALGTRISLTRGI